MTTKILAVTIIILLAGTVGFNLNKLPYFAIPTGQGGEEVPVEVPIDEPIEQEPLTIKQIRKELGKMVIACDELYDDLKISEIIQ